MKRDDKPNSLRVLEWIDEKFMVIRNIWWWFFLQVVSGVIATFK